MIAALVLQALSQSPQYADQLLRLAVLTETDAGCPATQMVAAMVRQGVQLWWTLQQ